jgi:drug/metabolite transporter (DMT)-like permease
MGVVYAVIALVCWGIGDFLIQRSARKLGDWSALFFITFLGSLGLLPFIYKDIGALTAQPLTLIWIGVGIVVMFLASLCDFEALRRGKIAVVETMYALEIPIAGFLAGSFFAERISAWQSVTIIAIVLGLALTATQNTKALRAWRWERGVALAVAATIGMGLVSVFVGWGGREIGAALVNWCLFTGVAILCFARFAWQQQIHRLVRDWRQHAGLILAVSFFTACAWVVYAQSAQTLPIAITTAISEGYIAVAAALGILINRERVRLHQRIGLVLTVLATIMLIFMTA